MFTLTPREYTLNPQQSRVREYSLNPEPYRGTSLIRNRPPLGPYSRTMSKGLWWPYGGVIFLESEVPLYTLHPETQTLGCIGRMKEEKEESSLGHASSSSPPSLLLSSI